MGNARRRGRERWRGTGGDGGAPSETAMPLHRALIARDALVLRAIILNTLFVAAHPHGELLVRLAAVHLLLGFPILYPLLRDLAVLVQPAPELPVLTHSLVQRLIHPNRRKRGKIVVH